MNSKVLDIAERAGAVDTVTQRANARVPWNGAFADSELTMPGGLLLAALTACANSRGHHFTKMASELGVTYGYIAQLRNGTRLVPQISDDFAMACASYLMVPRLTVLMLAGRIVPADFFESNEVMVSEVRRAFEYVCSDPKWGPLVTAEMRLANVESHFGLVRLYEGATGKVLMPRALNETVLAREVAAFQDVQQKLKAEVAAGSAARKRGPRKAHEPAEAASA